MLLYNGSMKNRPLLGWMKKGRYVPATYEWFVCKLKFLCTKAGLVGKFGTHSFRHCGATTLSMIGVLLPEISKKGDWKSLCVLRYLNRPLSNLVHEEKYWCDRLLNFKL